MVGGGVNQRGKIDAPPQSIARLKCVWLLLILLDKVAFKFQTFKTFLSGRFEFDGGWGGVGLVVVCKVIFMSNPTSVEVKLG